MRVEPDLNRFIWSRGIRNVDRKVRVRIARKRNEDDDAKEKFAQDFAAAWAKVMHLDRFDLA